MNLNQLAKAICKIEGGKVNLTIAQIKEVIKCIGIVSQKDPFILDHIYELGLYHVELVSKVSAGKVQPTAAPVRNKDTGKTSAKSTKKPVPKKSGKGRLASRKPRGAKT